MPKTTDMFDFNHKSATCMIIDWLDGTATLSDVYAVDRRKGHATELLNTVMRWADERGLVLKTAAAAHGEGDRMSTLQLVEFYSKFGFARTENIEDDYIYMERPRK